MTYEQLKEYISIILDMEKNIYIQKNTLENMYRKRNSLGVKRNIDIPSCEKSQTDYVEYMLRVGLIFGAIGFVIDTIARWGEFWDNSGIFVIILALLFGLFIALIAGLISAIIIGPFVAIYVSHKEQEEYNAHYQYRMKEYDHQKTNDDNRVKNENVFRANIQQEIDLLEKSIMSQKRDL